MCLEVLTNTTDKVGQDRRCLVRNLKLVVPKIKRVSVTLLMQVIRFLEADSMHVGYRIGEIMRSSIIYRTR